jgi:hypothetical protein
MEVTVTSLMSIRAIIPENLSGMILRCKEVIPATVWRQDVSTAMYCLHLFVILPYIITQYDRILR